MSAILRMHSMKASSNFKSVGLDFCRVYLGSGQLAVPILGYSPPPPLFFSSYTNIPRISQVLFHYSWKCPHRWFTRPLTQIQFVLVVQGFLHLAELLLLRSFLSLVKNWCCNLVCVLMNCSMSHTFFLPGCIYF